MRELLEGRRLGFSPRPQLGHVAVGLAIATTLLDLMAWFQWGPRDTNGLVVGAYAAAIATAVAAGIAALMAAVELTDTPREERPLARLDLIAALAGVALAGGSAALRAGELNAAGAAPLPFLLAIAALVALLADGVVAANLYSGREWEEPDEELVRDQRPRRRASAR